jgi:hypothetical protein
MRLTEQQLRKKINFILCELLGRKSKKGTLLQQIFGSPSGGGGGGGAGYGDYDYYGDYDHYDDGDDDGDDGDDGGED